MVKNQSPCAFNNGFTPSEPFSFGIFGKLCPNKFWKHKEKFNFWSKNRAIFQKKNLKNQEYALEF
jgi:hypothetical protein